jgi:2-oxoglutarate ferredoxin oxidoreductase subunit alpha
MIEMVKEQDVFTFLVGGAAGEGVKKAGSVAAHIFTNMGRHVFQMDDYQSLIKGGHNFSVVSTSINPINSHYMDADLVINLDSRSYDIHSMHVKENGILVYNSDRISTKSGLGLPLTSLAKDYPNQDLILGVAGIAILTASIGLEKSDLEKIIKEQYSKDLENNLTYADSVYELVINNSNNILKKYIISPGDKSRKILTGNEAISLGAAAGGLDIYIAYPMTPASSVLHFLAAHDKELGIAVMHPENEIAVANIAIGSAFAGARSAVGSSGGGFALMQEAFSLAGMTETPLLCILSSRPGPSTGVPTYTGQGDLRFALNQGHGDFPRIVASPGSIEEAFYLTAEVLNLVWQVQTPGILLTEKHLSESSQTVELDPNQAAWSEHKVHAPNESNEGTYQRYKDTLNGISPMLFPPSNEQIYWNSYEHDEFGITTEDFVTIARMHDKRNRKVQTIIDMMKSMKTVNEFGKGEPLIVTYGSTTMSVLEAVKKSELDITVIQPKYLEPFPVWEFEKYKERSCIVVEQSSSGQFAHLIKEKMSMNITNLITQYDGRPFEPVHLGNMLLEVC